MRKILKYKTCPRCKEKNPLSSSKCEECGLIFARLNFASNKLAKKNILKSNKDDVVYVSNLPSDVNKWLLIALTIFTGAFGGHCFYVGKFKKAVFMMLCGIATILCTFIAFEQIKTFSYLVSIPVGIMGFMWMFDIAAVIFGKFKVPISIDLTRSISDGK